MIYSIFYYLTLIFFSRFQLYLMEKVKLLLLHHKVTILSLFWLICFIFKQRNQILLYSVIKYPKGFFSHRRIKTRKLIKYKVKLLNDPSDAHIIGEKVFLHLLYFKYSFNRTTLIFYQRCFDHWKKIYWVSYFPEIRNACWNIGKHHNKIVILKSSVI